MLVVSCGLGWGSEGPGSRYLGVFFLGWVGVISFFGGVCFLGVVFLLCCCLCLFGSLSTVRVFHLGEVSL